MALQVASPFRTFKPLDVKNVHTCILLSSFSERLLILQHTLATLTRGNYVTH